MEDFNAAAPMSYGLQRGARIICLGAVRRQLALLYHYYPLPTLKHYHYTALLPTLWPCQDSFGGITRKEFS